MRLSVFESIYKAYVKDTIDGDWDFITDILMCHNEAKAKDDVLLFNFAKFKPLGEAEEAHKNLYVWDPDTKRNVATGEFEYIPNTIRRCKGNIVEIYGIVLDVDGEMTLEEVIEKYMDYEYVLYTTFRHQKPDENGNKVDKFRVVLPFSQPLKAEDIPGREASIKAAFPGVDGASFTASQSFYFHSGNYEPLVCRNRGQFIDPYSFEEQIINTNHLEVTIDPIHRANRMTLPLIETLLSGSNLHYNDCLPLAVFCKSIGITESQYIGIVQNIAAHNSVLRTGQIDLGKLYKSGYNTNMTKAKTKQLLQRINCDMALFEGIL